MASVRVTMRDGSVFDVGELSLWAQGQAQRWALKQGLGTDPSVVGQLLDFTMYGIYCDIHRDDFPPEVSYDAWAREVADFDIDEEQPEPRPTVAASAEPSP